MELTRQNLGAPVIVRAYRHDFGTDDLRGTIEEIGERFVTVAIAQDDWQRGLGIRSLDVSPGQLELVHGVRTIGTSRSKNYSSSRGRHVVYGYCLCGAGTTNSGSREFAERKIKAHAAGDDRGMVPA